MKTIFKLTLLLFLFQLGACYDDDPSARQTNLKLLTASTWGNAQVMHATDGNLSDRYNDFAILFTKKPNDGFEGTFIVSNGGPAFPEVTGQWKFSADLGKIIFDSGRELNFQVESTHLQLDFIVPDNPGGRTDGLSGHFTFDLEPM